MHSNKFNWGKYQLVFLSVFDTTKELCDSLKSEIFFSKYIYNLDKNQFNEQLIFL